MRKNAGKHGTLYIGTSGWVYPHWRGPVYPSSVPEASWLTHFAQRLSTVEINSSFYRLPSEQVISGWCGAVPSDFVFALKASRYITHMKKLNEPERTLPALLACAELFGERLGPLLFQLPPRWHANPARLGAFLAALPSDLRAVFEFRDTSWFCDEVIELLRRHGVAACIYDLSGYRSPRVSTADFTYLRLHGPLEAYRGGYSEEALREWAVEIDGWLSQGIDVYCYFDNDEAGHAFFDAERLRRILGA